MQDLDQSPFQFPEPVANAVSQSGAGKDFVLFDDSVPPSSVDETTGLTPGQSSYAAFPASSFDSSLASAAPISQPFDSIMPALARSKPSFTQYRAPHRSTVGGADGTLADSPFSSPVSRMEDDFNANQAGPSSLGSSGSGTLSSATGIPNRKRQKGNGSRGQGSTSSLTGLATAMSSNPSKDRVRGSRSSTNLHRHRHSIGGEPPSSVPGLLDSTSSYFSTGDDWSLAETSPQNPPSGSFGPPIGSLSITSDGSGDDYLPLFNELQTSQQQGSQQTSSQDFNSFFGLLQMSGQSTNRSQSGNLLQNDNSTGIDGNNALFAMSQPARTEPTAEQEATARRQVRQDLAAIDQRALRGPLRDLAQGNDAGFDRCGADDKASQAAMDAAFRAVVQDFVAAIESNRQRLGDSRAPRIGLGSDQAALVSAAPGNISQKQQRNLLFPGSDNDSSITESPFPSASNWTTGLVAQRPPPGPRKRSNSFDASFLPASESWIGQSPSQQVSAPEGLAGTSMPQPGRPDGVGIGIGTGWAGQSTNSFNAFDLSGSGTADPSKVSRRPLTRDRSGLTCSPQETYPNHTGPAGVGAGSMWQNSIGSLFGGTANNQAVLNQAMKNIKDTSNVATPKSHIQGPWPGKPPTNRENTVKPLKTQQYANVPSAAANNLSTASHKRAHPASSSSASSGLSLYSPGGSDTTPSMDDDADERPYTDWHSALLAHSGQGSLPKQQTTPRQGSVGNAPMPSRSHLVVNNPSFLASSTSSSEEEEEINITSFNNIRGFGPLSFGSSDPALPNALLPTSQGGDVGSGLGQVGSAPSQPLARGRDLQQGYEYTPSSTESDLQRDVSRSFGAAMKSYTEDTTISMGDVTDFVSQSQEDGSLSPSIRSTAQVIETKTHPRQQWALRHQVQQAKADYGGYPLPNADSSKTSEAATRRSSVTSAHSDASGSSAESQCKGPDAAARDESAESDCEPGMDSTDATSGPGRPRKNKVTSTGSRKGTSRGGARKGTASLRNQRSAQTIYGHSVAGQQLSENATSSAVGISAQARSSVNSGGVSQHGSLTVCEYLSPVTGVRCGTEFHRLYDLARHRETIHAKEEATMMRQGKLTRHQCRVLYVEVDPEKSQATQEWKCGGRNGCGSVFSRKDALQRHKRLRNH